MEADGHEFYRQWEDLADLIISEEHAQRLSPYGLLSFLDNIDSLSRTNDDRILSYVDSGEDGVNMTPGKEAKTGGTGPAESASALTPLQLADIVPGLALCLPRSF